MTDPLLAAILPAIKAAVREVLEEAGVIGAGAGEDYSKSKPPPQGWRFALDAFRAGKVRASKVGRRIVITRKAWADFVASCAVAPKPRRARAKGADPMARFPRRAA